MTRLLIAWMAFITGLAFFTFDLARWDITGLAVAGVALIVVWLWLIGGFEREFWVADDPYDATTSLDVLEEQHR